MRRFIIILLLLPILLIFAGAATGEQKAMVTERWQERREGVVVEDREKTTKMLIPDPGATPGEVKSIVRKEGRKLADDIKKEIGKQQQGSNAKTAAVVQSVDEKVDGLSDKSDAIENGVKGIGEKTDGLKKDLNDICADVDDSRATLSDLREVFYILCGSLIALFFLILIWAIISRKNGNKKVLRAINDAKNEEAMGFVQVQDRIAQIPGKTAAVIEKSKASDEPLTYKIAAQGIVYDVVYIPDKELAKEGKYQILYVPKGIDPATPVENIERPTRKDRNEASASIKGTLTKYLEGKFNERAPQGKQQIELIKYLQDIGSLTINKST